MKDTPQYPILKKIEKDFKVSGLIMVSNIMKSVIVNISNKK